MAGKKIGQCLNISIDCVLPSVRVGGKNYNKIRKIGLGYALMFGGRC